MDAARELSYNGQFGSRLQKFLSLQSPEQEDRRLHAERGPRAESRQTLHLLPVCVKTSR